MWRQRLALAAGIRMRRKRSWMSSTNGKRRGPSKTMRLEHSCTWSRPVLLAQLDLRKEAAQKCKEGLDFKPHDPMVRATLEQS